MIDVDGLSAHAERYFGAQLEVVGRKQAETRIAFRSKQGGFDASFTLVSRRVEKSDIRAARDAEVRGQVPGMGALAERCKHVWEVHEGDDVPVHTSYLLCAVLASVALGPVLPPEHDTLLGVRSARARAESSAPGYRG